MKFMEFILWTEGSERQYVHIDPRDISSIREHQDRRAYGDWNNVSEIVLKNGQKYVVYHHGHPQRLQAILDAIAEEERKQREIPTPQ